MCGERLGRRGMTAGSECRAETKRPYDQNPEFLPNEAGRGLHDPPRKMMPTSPVFALQWATKGRPKQDCLAFELLRRTTVFTTESVLPSKLLLWILLLLNLKSAARQARRDLGVKVLACQCDCSGLPVQKTLATL